MVSPFTKAVWVLMLASLPFFGTAAAQTKGPEENGERLQKMIDELRQRLDRAEQEREADPWLIRDLRELLARYEYPWTRTVYSQKFDRESRSAPSPWRVTTGTFRVTERGLHSIVTPRRGPDEAEAEPPSEAGSPPKQEEGGRGRDLFGAILEEALKGREQGSDSPSQPEEKEPEESQDPEAARALLPERTANAFALRLTFTARAPGEEGSEWSVGPYQGGKANLGYRLLLRPKAGEEKTELELIKRGTRGTTSTVARSEGSVLVADGEAHTLTWTRTREGRMRVELDDEPVFEATDRGFRDPFAGFVVRNGGGDLAIASLTVREEPERAAK